MISDKKKSALRLWEECFEDTEQFVEFYFNNIYKDRYTYIGLNMSTPVSHLQTIPYRISIDGKTFPANYISGACTSEEARGKGYIRSLMLEALGERKKKGDIYSILIPANDELFNFYETKLGYKPFFFEEKTESISLIKDFLPNNPIKATDIIGIIKNIERLRIFPCVKHSIGQIRNIIREYEIFENYDIIYIKDNNHTFHGVAFVECNGEHILIKEIFCSRNSSDYLFEKIITKYPNKKIFVTTPISKYSDTKSIKKGMIKCLYEDDRELNGLISENIGFLSLMHE